MFQSMRRSMLVVVACLLCGSFVPPTAHAGIIQTPVQIEGDYASDQLVPPPTPTNPNSYPWTLDLSDGTVTTPNTPPLFGFTADPLTVTITTTSNVNLGSTFTLSGPIPGPPAATETIVYNITPGTAHVADSNTIAAGITLLSNTASTNPPGVQISLAKLSPATLLLIFPSQDVKFEPSFTPPAAPVIFEIVQTPEPASIVYLAWGGVLGVIGSWRRYRRRANSAIV